MLIAGILSHIKLDDRITVDLTPQQRGSRLLQLRAERKRLLQLSSGSTGMEALQYTVQAVQVLSNML